MLELRISTHTAATLLKERMKYELKLQKVASIFEHNIYLENLNRPDLLKIAEIAAFDLIFLLPAEILLVKNNLASIVTKSMRALAKDFPNSELENYQIEKAEKLLEPIREAMQISKDKKLFLTN